MRYLDVCAGISAPTMAWHSLGWKALCYAEIDAAPRAVLAHHYPDVPLVGDFTQIKGDEYGPVDLLVGGTPCQDFSVAGLRAGLDGERGNLSLEYLRLADRARPRWLVWENVPGVLSIDGGRAFGAILGGMAQLGYGFAYRVLDAQHFGVPQRRRRVFVVGYLGDWRRAAAVLFERHSLQGNPPPRREAGEEIAGVLTSRASGGGGGPGAGTDEACAGYLQAIASTGDTSHCLNAGGMGRQDYETETFIAHALRGEGFDASEDGTGRGTPLAPLAFNSREDPVSGDCFGALGSSSPQAQAVAFTQNSRSEVREIGGDGQIVGALAADAGAQQQNYVAFGISSDAVDRSGEGDGSAAQRAGLGIVEEASPALRTRAQAVAYDLRGREEGAQFEGPHDTANMRAASGGSSRSYVAASAVRRLTPRECERLQGFPDDFTLVPYRKGMMADGPRYKMLGNSMAVPVVRWIGERIAMVEAMCAVAVDRAA